MHIKTCQRKKYACETALGLTGAKYRTILRFAPMFAPMHQLGDGEVKQFPQVINTLKKLIY